MQIERRPIDDEMHQQIHQSCTEAQTLLRLTDTATSEQTVKSVDECVFAQQKAGGLDEEEEAELALKLGSLWGQQLVTNLGWQWATVTFGGDAQAQAVGVFSPDYSLAIYPFHFVLGCLANQAPVTIALAYNMLVDGRRIPTLPAGTFENVMDHVHHTVPRR